MGFYDKSDKVDWEEGSSIYFRYMPREKSYEWAYLVMMSLLEKINQVYNDPQETIEIKGICH